MKQSDIFAQALQLPESWVIETVEFQKDNQEALHIQIKYKSPQYFLTHAGNQYPIQDHVEVTYRHFNFLNHTCYIHWLLPRYMDDLKHLNVATPPVEKNYLT